MKNQENMWDKYKCNEEKQRKDMEKQSTNELQRQEINDSEKMRIKNRKPDKKTNT